jgi:hypothetical protein
MQAVETPTMDPLLPENNSYGAGIAEEKLFPVAAPATTTTTTTSSGAPPACKQSNGGPTPPPPRTSSIETGVAVAGPEAIGREIAIWSKSTGDWPKGIILAFHKDTNLHTIKSPTSGERTIDLSRIRWQWVKRPTLDSTPNPTFDKKYTGEAAIGCKVRCFWPGMGRWYTGKVQTYDGKTQQHTVKFRDGDIQHYVMKHEAMLFLDPPRPVVVNVPESKTPKKVSNNINSGGGGKSREGSKVVTTAAKMPTAGKNKKSLNALSNNKKAAGKVVVVGKPLDGGVVKVKKSQKQTEKSLVKKPAKKNKKNAANNSHQVDNKSNKSSSGGDMVTPSPGTTSPPKEQLVKGKKKAASTKRRKKPLPPLDASSDDDDEDIPLIQRGNVTIDDILSDDDDEVLSDVIEDDEDEMSFNDDEDDEEDDEDDEEDDEEVDDDDMDVDERALVAEPGDSDFEVESNRGRKPNKKKKKKDKTIKNAAPKRLKTTATGDNGNRKKKTQKANINKMNNNSSSMLNGNKRDSSSKKKAPRVSRSKDATAAVPKRGSGGSRSIKGIRSPPRNQTVSEVGVGCRVAVYWAEDNTCYKGRLAQFDSYHKRHKLIYDDGEEEWVALSREKFAWLTPRAASSGCSVQARETVVNLTKSDTMHDNNSNGGHHQHHHHNYNNNNNNGMSVTNLSFASSEFTWAPMNQPPSTTVVASLDEYIVNATTATDGLDNDDDAVNFILPPRDTNTNTAAASLSLENQDALNAAPTTTATKAVLNLPGGPFVGSIGGSLHHLPGHHGVGTKEPQGPGVATKDTPLGTATFSSEGHQQLTEDQAMHAIGWLVSLYCPADKLWYHGEVVGFDRKRGKHNILYDDGEHDWCFVSQEKLIWHAQTADNDNNNTEVSKPSPKAATKPAVAPRYPGVKDHHEIPHSTAALGWRVGVYWPLELVFYTGEIIAWDGEEGQYEVAYDDGEEGTFYIATDKIKWLVAPGDSASPARLRERRESDPVAKKRFGGGKGGGGYGGRGGGFAGNGVHHGGDSDPDYDEIYERGKGTSVGGGGGGRGRGRGSRMMMGPHGYYYNGGFDGRFNHQHTPSGVGFTASPYADLKLKTGRPLHLGGGQGSTSMLVASPTTAGAMLPPPPLCFNHHSSDVGGGTVYVPETYEGEPVLHRKMTHMPAFAGCDMQLQTPLSISIYLNHSSEAANDDHHDDTNDTTKQQPMRGQQMQQQQQKGCMLAGNSRRTPQHARLQARHSALKEMGRRVARAQQTIVKGIPTKMPSMQLYNQMYAASTRQYMNGGTNGSGQFAHQQHALVPDGGNVHRLARSSGMVMSPFAGAGGSEEMHLNKLRRRPDESEDEEDEDDNDEGGQQQQQQQQEPEGAKKKVDADGDDFKIVFNSFSGDKATAGNPSGVYTKKNQYQYTYNKSVFHNTKNKDNINNDDDDDDDGVLLIDNPMSLFLPFTDDDGDEEEQVILSPKSPAGPRGAKVKPGTMTFGAAGGGSQRLEEEEELISLNNSDDNDNDDPLMVLNVIEEKDVLDLTVGTAGCVIGADRDVLVVDEPLKEAAAAAVVVVETQTAATIAAPAHITTTVAVPMQNVEGRSNSEDANNAVGGVVSVEDKMPLY